MKKFFVMIAISMLSLAANAGEARPVWLCGLAFEGESKGFQLILGSFRTEATGELRCTDALGGTYARPVRITMGTRVIGPAVGVGQFELAGVSAQISLLNKNPEVLFGNYLVAQGEGALALGAAAFTAVRVKPPQVAVQISLQVIKGWGAHVGIHRMKIEPLD